MKTYYYRKVFFGGHTVVTGYNWMSFYSVKAQEASSWQKIIWL